MGFHRFGDWRCWDLVSHDVVLGFGDLVVCCVRVALVCLIVVWALILGVVVASCVDWFCVGLV